MRFLRTLRFELTLFTTLVAGGALFAWGSSFTSATNEPGFQLIEADDLEPFRSAFDSASDRVRAVLLVGPT